MGDVNKGKDIFTNFQKRWLQKLDVSLSRSVKNYVLVI